MTAPPSQQVNWSEVNRWVQPYLDAAGAYPWPGTPAWCLLPDDSRQKWAALLDFAQHHALRVETAQDQRAEVSRAVAAAADWANIAAGIRRRHRAHIKRVTT